MSGLSLCWPATELGIEVDNPFFKHLFISQNIQAGAGLSLADSFYEKNERPLGTIIKTFRSDDKKCQ